MDVILRAHELKVALIDFVLDAEGELATALETYAAEQSRRGSGDSKQQDFIIDSFAIEGKVGNKTPLDLFCESHPDLPDTERNLIRSWHRSFIGLFAVVQILPNGFELVNWLTNKHYIVKPNALTIQEMSRFKVGEIFLTRIAPVTDTEWMFFGSHTLLGKLGKPKLAVAIGNFKDNYKNNLYGDAPYLLEEAWLSVEKYHQEFVDFFGSDEITLPGYQLNKKVVEFQELMTEKRLAEAGIDTSKSLAEAAEAAGIDEEEIKAAAEELGADSKVVSEVFNNKSANNKMVMPKVDLPAELRKAEQVTALSHPRWGQMFLPTYGKMKAILEADVQNIEGSEKLIRYFLEDKSINAFVWYRLAEQYPIQLEKVLQSYLQRPDFRLESDFKALLQEFNKLIEPELPEIASVPIHLHNLFQEALADVNKSKSKDKGKKADSKGFSAKLVYVVSASAVEKKSTEVLTTKEIRRCINAG